MITQILLLCRPRLGSAISQGHTAECVLIHADPGMQASVGAKSIPNDSQTAADFSDNFREISILLALSREFNDATYLFEK